MQRTRTLFKMLTPPIWLGALILSLNLCGGLARASDEPDDDKDHPHSTAEDFLRSNVRPIAIGHHGVGPNTGENPALPIENTVDSVRLPTTWARASSKWTYSSPRMAGWPSSTMTFSATLPASIL